MSLLGRIEQIVPSGPPAAEPGRVDPPRRLGGPDGLRGPDAIYLLVYNDPESPSPSYGKGWTLLSSRGRDPRRGAASLAGHGAGALAGPRVAQAVAVRVLADHGVAVGGWHECYDEDSLAAVYRAVLGSDLGGDAVPAAGTPSSEPRVRGWRRGWSPGH
ncbi:hypothetical protein [Actinomycetospora sp.]|jgi:hypothetical protein|uniref:hypothetical protein n=1 Tax=Actinomycetospora sp. TaxID=1872135 RepID=UPI002F42538C